MNERLQEAAGLAILPFLIAAPPVLGFAGIYTAREAMAAGAERGTAISTGWSLGKCSLRDVAVEGGMMHITVGYADPEADEVIPESMTLLTADGRVDVPLSGGKGGDNEGEVRGETYALDLVPSTGILPILPAIVTLELSGHTQVCGITAIVPYGGVLQ